jgi:hypothetical protein
MKAIGEEELGDILLERIGMQDAVDGAKVFVLKNEKSCLEKTRKSRRTARAQVSLSMQSSIVSCRHSLEEHSQGTGVEH